MPSCLEPVAAGIAVAFRVGPFQGRAKGLPKYASYFRPWNIRLLFTIKHNLIGVFR